MKLFPLGQTSLFYDNDSNPINPQRAAQLLGSRERFIAETYVGRYCISTVNIVIGRRHFETMVRDVVKNEFLDDFSTRSETKPEALQDHEYVVELVMRKVTMPVLKTVITEMKKILGL